VDAGRLLLSIVFLFEFYYRDPCLALSVAPQTIGFYTLMSFKVLLYCAAQRSCALTVDD
jgi:hypothetical protein